MWNNESEERWRLLNNVADLEHLWSTIAMQIW